MIAAKKTKLAPFQLGLKFEIKRFHVFNDHERLLSRAVNLIGQIVGKIIRYIFLDVTTMFIFWLNKLY